MASVMASVMLAEVAMITVALVSVVSMRSFRSRSVVSGAMMSRSLSTMGVTGGLFTSCSSVGRSLAALVMPAAGIFVSSKNRRRVCIFTGTAL